MPILAPRLRPARDLSRRALSGRVLPRPCTASAAARPRADVREPQRAASDMSCRRPWPVARQTDPSACALPISAAADRAHRRPTANNHLEVRVIRTAVTKQRRRARCACGPVCGRSPIARGQIACRKTRRTRRDTRRGNRVRRRGAALARPVRRRDSLVLRGAGLSGLRLNRRDTSDRLAAGDVASRDQRQFANAPAGAPTRRRRFVNGARISRTSNRFLERDRPA